MSKPELDRKLITYILKEKPETFSHFYVPSQSFEDAMDMVNAVKKMGYTVFLQFTHQDNLNACYISYGYASPDRVDEVIEHIQPGEIISRAQDKSMALAICLACEQLIPFLK